MSKRLREPEPGLSESKDYFLDLVREREFTYLSRAVNSVKTDNAVLSAVFMNAI